MLLYGKNPTVYEVITEDQPVLLYMNIDLSLGTGENSFTFNEVNALIIYIKNKLIEHLHLSFTDLRDDFDHENNLKVMHSCSSLKFSLHIVHRVVFDNNSCSCVSYVLEFDAFVKMNIQSGVRRELDEDGEYSTNTLLAKNRLRNHPSFIDKSVYKKSQQFRTLDCSKIRKNRPLLLYNSPLSLKQIM